VEGTTTDINTNGALSTRSGGTLWNASRTIPAMSFRAFEKQILIELGRNRKVHFEGARASWGISTKFLSFKPRGNDVLVRESQIITIGMADFLGKTMQTQPLQQTRDLPAGLLPQMSARGFVVQAAQVEPPGHAPKVPARRLLLGAAVVTGTKPAADLGYAPCFAKIPCLALSQMATTAGFVTFLSTEIA
jgi:hypothetical protein